MRWKGKLGVGVEEQRAKKESEREQRVVGGEPKQGTEARETTLFAAWAFIHIRYLLGLQILTHRRHPNKSTSGTACNKNFNPKRELRIRNRGWPQKKSQA